MTQSLIDKYFKLTGLKSSEFSPDGHYDYRETFSAFPRFCQWRNETTKPEDVELVDSRGDTLVTKQQIVDYLSLDDPFRLTDTARGVIVPGLIVPGLYDPESPTHDFLIVRDWLPNPEGLNSKEMPIKIIVKEDEYFLEVLLNYSYKAFKDAFDAFVDKPSKQGLLNLKQTMPEDMYNDFVQNIHNHLGDTKLIKKVISAK